MQANSVWHYLLLLRFQGGMISRTLRMGWQTLSRSGRHQKLEAILPVSRVLLAPSKKLVTHYIFWCGAQGRYPTTLPPHMVAQWSLPLVADLLLQTPFPVTKVINQGIALRIHGDLPRAVALHLQATLKTDEITDERIRLSVSVWTGTADQPKLVELILHMVFLIHRPAQGTKKITPVEDIAWINKGSWTAEKQDGLKFALLTGDFNPIHWLGIAGKLSPFGKTVLQGFGSFARSFEQVADKKIAEMEGKFLRPVSLNSALVNVEQAQQSEQGSYQLRLRGANDHVHFVGRVKYHSY